MYIHNYQSQCSDVISHINYVEDPAKLTEKMKNNWGLPRVDDFIDPKTIVNKAATVAKPKKISSSSSGVAISKKVLTKPILTEQDWPSLPMSTAKRTKKKKPSIEI